MQSLTFPIRGHLVSMNVEVSDHLHHRETEFQTIDIYETPVFGKFLFLDGHVQLSEFDERAYHELLVQLPLLNLPNATSALIVGGGDGGALRELCRNPMLTKIEMVEIDAGVIEASREFLPTLSAGAFDDPRVTVHVADAFGFVKERSAAYDLIILDSTDTYEGEDGALSEALFTRSFYQDCLAALKPGGIAVTQADNPIYCPYSLAAIRAEFEAVFPLVGSYQGLVPSFGGMSAFCWGSRALGGENGESGIRKEWREPAYPLRHLNAQTYGLAFTELQF